MPASPCKLAARLALATALLGVLPARAATPAAVSKLDPAQLVGTWYEVSRFPIAPEKRCVRDALVLYSYADKRKNFQMVTSCYVKDGYPDSWNANGKLSKTGDGRLKVSRIFPFTAKYWVLAEGPAQEWLLIGSPNHKSLWILSRTDGLAPGTLASITAQASALGYNTAKLVPMPQHVEHIASSK